MENNPGSIRGQDTSRLSVNQKSSFDTTHWSLVIDASNSDERVSTAALEALCQRYWHPIYVFIRRKGNVRSDAEDFTQAFFAHLLDKDLLKRATPEKGRFRTYLLSMLNNFLINEWQKRTALKRGSGQKIISINEMEAEELYSRERADLATPEKLFERRWTLVLLAEVLRRLAQEYANEGRADVFAALEPGLTGETEPGWTAKVAADFKITESTARVQLHRMRKRYGELLRDEIGRTLANPDDVDDEIKHLFAALGKG